MRTNARRFAERHHDRIGENKFVAEGYGIDRPMRQLVAVRHLARASEEHPSDDNFLRSGHRGQLGTALNSLSRTTRS
jgi:hypothetical protein